MEIYDKAKETKLIDLQETYLLQSKPKKLLILNTLEI
jgi:hypothetical protein